MTGKQIVIEVGQFQRHNITGCVIEILHHIVTMDQFVIFDHTIMEADVLDGIDIDRSYMQVADAKGTPLPTDDTVPRDEYDRLNLELENVQNKLMKIKDAMRGWIEVTP